MAETNVVVVDDELPIRESLRMFSWERYNFHLAGVARNGSEALELCRRQSAHIVITDIVMPVMDGLELIRQLRQWNESVQVILLTTYSDFDYARQALVLGACDYLLKGTYRESDLVAALQKAKERLPQPEWRVADDKRYEIRKALAYMHQNLGKSLTMHEIADHVGLSPNYFGNIFRRELNEGFHDYVKRVRLEKAAHLLRHSNKKVYEIAAEVGIPNYRYFTDVFRKQFGVSPREYREYVE